MTIKMDEASPPKSSGFRILYCRQHAESEEILCLRGISNLFTDNRDVRRLLMAREMPSSSSIDID